MKMTVVKMIRVALMQVAQLIPQFLRKREGKANARAWKIDLIL